MSSPADTIFFSDGAAFELWLETNHVESDGVWIRMAKKHTGVDSLDWTTGVDVALCFGWIDGQLRRIDADWFMQRFGPRRPRSAWSKRNRERIERLLADGRMRPEGLAEVERARSDGRWDAAYDSPSTATIPDELAEALEARGLTAAFAALKAQERYAALYRLQTAKKPETRARHVATVVDALVAGEVPFRLFAPKRP